MPQIFCLLSGARKTLRNLGGNLESEPPIFCSVFFFLFNIILYEQIRGLEITCEHQTFRILPCSMYC